MDIEPWNVMDVIKKVIDKRDLPFFHKILAIHIIVKMAEADEPIELTDKEITSMFEVDRGFLKSTLKKLKELKIIRRMNPDDHGVIPIYSAIDLE